MFTPARYVVLDDEASELEALVEALHVLGAPCIGIKFDPLGLPDPTLFAGLRILFSDLHLVKAQAAGVQHYDTLGSILDRCVPAQHGPYLLVLWTSHENERAALTDRLEQILPPAKRPLAVLALDKTRFQIKGGGWDADAIRVTIREQISTVPQLEALLNWERDVLAAANTTLALLAGLVPDDQRATGTYSGALDRILSVLATAAAGAHAANDRKGAVNAALSPLLTDRILNQPQNPQTAQVWERAVTFQPGAPLTSAQKAQIHRMLHLAVPPGEVVNQSDWGAIIPLGQNHLSDDGMNARFGVTVDHLRDREFKLKQSRREEGALVVIRGGAACDQAQANAGPIPLFLGILVPTTALSSNSRSPAILTSGEQFDVDGYNEPISLLVHARFSTTIVNQDLLNWPAAILRLREQLLSTILVHVANYAMRPGTLRF